MLIPQRRDMSSLLHMWSLEESLEGTWTIARRASFNIVGVFRRSISGSQSALRGTAAVCTALHCTSASNKRGSAACTTPGPWRGRRHRMTKGLC